jgi:signal transduction histidine kinase
MSIKVNILLVDGQPGKLLSYEAILSQLGENLIKAHSANEALECLLKNDVAVVVIDVCMPELDGFELADMISRHPRFQKTAIIFISGMHMTDMDRLKGYEHGAVDYISVPIIPELLRAKVRVFVELHRKARELEIIDSDMRQLSNRLVTVQDEERRRLARELHDGLGQELTAAKMIVDGIRAAESREKAEEASKLIQDALQQVRTISHLLHPPLLDELGLEAALRWYLEGLAKRSGIKTSLEIQPPHLSRFTPELENAVYRIVQEALTNVFRHSGAREARVELAQTNGQLTISVRDDGKGIPKRLTEFKPGSVGVGIGGMRQRVSELGGKLKLENANPGTLVQVVIPNTSAKMGEQVASEFLRRLRGNRPCGANESVQN